MSDALTRMSAWLIMSRPDWKPDRFDRAGPVFTPQPGTARQIRADRNPDPALKARILTELQKGKATSDEIAKRLHVPQQEVGAKLSRLYSDGHVERAMTAVSPHTGRKVLLYWLRENG